MVQYLVAETVDLADKHRHGITGGHFVVGLVLVMVVYALQGDGQGTGTDTERDNRGEVTRKGTQAELPGHARLRGKCHFRAAVAGLVIIHQDDVVLREVHAVAAAAESQDIRLRVDEGRGHQGRIAADAVVLRATGHVDEQAVVGLVKAVIPGGVRVRVHDTAGSRERPARGAGDHVVPEHHVAVRAAHTEEIVIDGQTAAGALGSGHGADTAGTDLETADIALLAVNLARELPVFRLDAPVLQYLEILVRGHKALQLDMVTGQLHHANLVPVGIRLVHAHTDKRQFSVSVLGIDAGSFRLHHQAGFLQHVLVTVKDGGRYLHQALRLLEKRLVAVREALHPVGREDEHVQVDVAGEGEPEVSRAVPETAARVLHVPVGLRQLLLRLQAVEVREARLVNVQELHAERAGRRAAVEEGEVDRHGLLLPTVVLRHGGHAFQVRALLQDVFITDAYHGAPVVHCHARAVTFLCQHVVVRPDPPVPGKEEDRLVLRRPLFQPGIERRVVQVALLRGEVAAQGRHRAGDPPLHDLELGLDVLARH